MKKNAVRAFAAVCAVIFICLTLCSCDESIASRYEKYDRGGERYDYDLTQYIALPEYSGIEIPDLVYEPTKEEIDDTRYKKLVYFSEEYVVEDGTVEMYDLVDCDFVTTVDGYEYQSMCSSSNSALRSMMIGIEEFDIPEIDELMLGMAPGETASVEFVFPTPYYRDPLLSGYTGEFTVTIDKIRRQNFAEYTDEFVSQYYGATDTASYDSTIEQQLKSDYSKYLENYEIDMVWDYLLDNSKLMKMPGDEYNDIFDDIIDSCLEAADEAGITLDEYAVNDLGYEDPDAFYADVANSAQATCEEEMILYIIARCEGMTISVSEYESALLEAAAELETQDISVCEDFVTKQYGQLSKFKEAVLFNKVFVFLGENATKIAPEEYYANKDAGKYTDVELEVTEKLSTVEILIIVCAALALVMVIVVAVLVVKAIGTKKDADIKAAEKAALEEKRRRRREEKAAKKKHYGKRAGDGDVEEKAEAYESEEKAEDEPESESDTDTEDEPEA